jgi:splicing factor 4
MLTKMGWKEGEGLGAESQGITAPVSKCVTPGSSDSVLKSFCLHGHSLCRGVQPIDGGGLGMERPANLSKDDDEFDAYRKRMMLAYRFRPNPMVSLKHRHPLWPCLLCFFSLAE